MADELTPEARKILRQGRALQKLSEYEEWVVFLDLISGQCDNWGALAVSRSRSIDEMTSREYEKGVLFGLRLAASLPSATFAQRVELMRANPQDPEVLAEEAEAIGLQKAP